MQVLQIVGNRNHYLVIGRLIPDVIEIRLDAEDHHDQADNRCDPETRDQQGSGFRSIEISSGFDDLRCGRCCGWFTVLDV